MGNNSRKSKIQFDPDLQFLQLNHNTQQYSQSSLYDEFFVNLSKKQIEAQYNFFQSRLKMQKYVAKPYQIQVIKNGHISDNNILLKLKIEKFTKLSSIQIINQIEALYLLLNMLYGFGEIYKFYKFTFKITQNMVGINSKGEVKVWINENFASNDFIKKQDTISEKQYQLYLVNSIFELVQENDQNYHYKNLLQKLKDQSIKKFTFVQTIVSIKKFARVNNYRIPVRIQRLCEQSIIKTSIIFIDKSSKSNIKKRRIQAIPTSVSPIKSQIIYSYQKQFDNIKNYSSMKNNQTNKSQVFLGGFPNKINSISINSNKQNLYISSQLKKEKRRVQIEGSVLIYEPSEHINESLLNATVRQEN